MTHCVKKSFETKAEAKTALSKIPKAPEGGKKPLRAYRCKKCGKFHLTSMTKATHRWIEHRRNPETKAKARIERLADYWIKKKGWNKE